MKNILILVSVLLVSNFANAQTKTKKKTTTTTTKTTTTPAPSEMQSEPESRPRHSGGGSYSAPWGMAGCSIWNYVIKEKEMGPQLAVWALERFVFGVQTFAITSGTSNCVEGGRGMAQNNEQEVFVTVNLANLQKEAAQGQGQHLNALAEILGCNDKEGFAQMSQNRYESLFTNENPSAVLQSYKSEIKQTNVACSRAG